MESLETKLNYKFNNIELLKNALVHSSYANEVRGNTHSNERLEFLGDSVLSIIVADHIYHKYPNMPEGELTRLRASLVCENNSAPSIRFFSADFFHLERLPALPSSYQNNG